MMNLSNAQKMIRYAYSSMYDQFGLDELTQMQAFLSSIDDDFLLTELEDYVAAILDTKPGPYVKAAKKIKITGDPSRMTKKELIEALMSYADDMPIITRDHGQTLTLKYIDTVDLLEAHIIDGKVYDCTGTFCVICHSNPNSTIRNIPILVFD